MNHQPFFDSENIAVFAISSNRFFCRPEIFPLFPQLKSDRELRERFIGEVLSRFDPSERPEFFEEVMKHKEELGLVERCYAAQFLEAAEGYRP